jgi:predicted N-acetyltransferase YhbS
MLASANVIVTARDRGHLVGVARGLSDFSFCFYLSDLAVDQPYQGLGIGRRLVSEAHDIAGLATTLILLAAPGAESYYPHIGLQPCPSCWIVPRQS